MRHGARISARLRGRDFVKVDDAKIQPEGLRGRIGQFVRFYERLGRTNHCDHRIACNAEIAKLHVAQENLRVAQLKDVRVHCFPEDDWVQRFPVW